MAAKTFLARVLWAAPDKSDADLGETLITIDEDYAHFKHDEKTVSGSVQSISPPDWEQSGLTPTVRVTRSI